MDLVSCHLPVLWTCHSPQPSKCLLHLHTIIMSEIFRQKKNWKAQRKEQCVALSTWQADKGYWWLCTVHWIDCRNYWNFHVQYCVIMRTFGSIISGPTATPWAWGREFQQRELKLKLPLSNHALLYERRLRSVSGIGSLAFGLTLGIPCMLDGQREYRTQWRIYI